MELHLNLVEQQLWNDPQIWEENHDIIHWSSNFSSVEELWSNLLENLYVPHLGSRTLEIAPGGGRITEFFLRHCPHLTLVEYNPVPLKFCIDKFGSRIDGYFLNDGKSLARLPDSFFDAIVSFDSFVHIHWDIFQSYLPEIYRVLKQGGKATLHHAWFGGGEDLSFQNLGGRANCDAEKLNSTLTEIGFEITLQTPCNPSPLTTDLITTFQKI